MSSTDCTNTVEEGTGTWPDGVQFYDKRWIPTSTQSPRALLILLHGPAEHIGLYNQVMPRSTERGIEVYGFDQRGFGRSGPTHGDTTLRQAMDDLGSMINKEHSRLETRDHGHGQTPVFLYGHSIGATTVLSLLTRTESDDEALQSPRPSIAGVILAPWVLRTKRPSPLLLTLAPWLAWLFPNIPLNKALTTHHVARSPAATESSDEDSPLQDDDSSDVYLQALADPLSTKCKLMDKSYKHWPAEVPLLITHGEEDTSTSSAASRRFIQKLDSADKECKLWPDMMYEGHCERPELRDLFIEYVIRWIKTRTPLNPAA